MKILAFTDLHASVTSYKKIQAKIKKEKPDAIFCLGDFTIFEQNIEAVLRKINDLGKTIYLIHGNHEMEQIVKKLAKNNPHIKFIHKQILKLGEYTIIAHGGGGFYGQGKLAGDKEFDNFVKDKKFTGKTILLTHAPPGHTKLDYIDWLDDHVGCASYKKFIDKHKPILALSGHIHESFYVKQKIGKTLVCNPGPEGMVFQI